MEKIIVQSRGSASPTQYLVGRDKLGAAWTWEQDRAMRMTPKKAITELMRLKKEGWRLAEILDYEDHASHIKHTGKLFLVNPCDNHKFPMWHKETVKIESESEVIGEKGKLLKHKVECGVCESLLLQGMIVKAINVKDKIYNERFRKQAKVKITVDDKIRLWDIPVKDTGEHVGSLANIPTPLFLAQEENGTSHGCFLPHATVMDVAIRCIPKHTGTLLVSTNLFVALYTTRDPGILPHEIRS